MEGLAQQITAARIIPCRALDNNGVVPLNNPSNVEIPSDLNYSKLFDVFGSAWHGVTPLRILRLNQPCRECFS